MKKIIHSTTNGVTVAVHSHFPVPEQMVSLLLKVFSNAKGLRLKLSVITNIEGKDEDSVFVDTQTGLFSSLVVNVAGFGGYVCNMEITGGLSHSLDFLLKENIIGRKIVFDKKKTKKVVRAKKPARAPAKTKRTYTPEEIKLRKDLLSCYKKLDKMMAGLDAFSRAS